MIRWLAFVAALGVVAVAPASRGAIRGVRLENTRGTTATVAIRSPDGRLLSEISLPGRASRYVPLEGSPRNVRVQVTRSANADAAARLLAGMVIAGAGRRGEASSGESSSHTHNGETCNDPSCGSDGGSGSSGSNRSAARGAALGVLLESARTTGDRNADATDGVQMVDGVRIAIDEDQPASTIEIQDAPPEPAHHCQGGRLIIIVGDFADPTIQASLRWAESLQAREHHLHLLAYPTGGSDKDPSWSIPHVPPPAGHTPTRASDIWPRYRTNDRNRNLNELVADWRDCCYFEEVMIMFHGGQSGNYRLLVEHLPRVLDGRAVRKLVLWSCKSTGDFYPGRGGASGEQNYRNIAHLVRPRACPCACAGGVCTARGPRGERTTCPTGEEPTIILASATVDGRAAKLGLAPGNARPLTTPNGELRRITVAPDGSVEAEVVAEGAVVIDGIRSRTDRDLVRESTSRVDPDRFLRASTTQAPRGQEIPYAGPRACANREGCIPNEQEERGLIR